MMLESTMLVSMMHVSMMLVSTMFVSIMHVFMMHVFMMHISMIVDPDACVYDANMYVAYIDDPQSLTLMHVYRMYDAESQ